MRTAPATPPTRAELILFEGLDRRDAKRQMLRYWSLNSAKLDMGLDEFARCCTLRPNGRTIVFDAARRHAA